MRVHQATTTEQQADAGRYLAVYRALGLYLALGPWPRHPQPRWAALLVGGFAAFYGICALAAAVFVGPAFAIATLPVGIVPMTARRCGSRPSAPRPAGSPATRSTRRPGTAGVPRPLSARVAPRDPPSSAPGGAPAGPAARERTRRRGHVRGAAGRAA